MSKRKVRAIAEVLCGLEVSDTQVSALTAKLDDRDRRVAAAVPTKWEPQGSRTGSSSLT